VAQIAKKADKGCITVFAGPVLAKNDPIYTWGFGDVQIPMKYWKVVITVENGKLCAYGLVLDQTQAFKDLGFERMNLGKFKEYETAIKDIEKLAGLVLDTQVVAADQKGN
jgi:DNA/RNA endonuclease G (NUC1)